MMFGNKLQWKCNTTDGECYKIFDANAKESNIYQYVGDCEADCKKTTTEKLILPVPEEFISRIKEG